MRLSAIYLEEVVLKAQQLDANVLELVERMGGSQHTCTAERAENDKASGAKVVSEAI